MKKINLLFLLALPSLSFTSKSNESFFSITSFEVDLNEENNTLTLSNKYTSTSDYQGYTVGLTWIVYSNNNKKVIDYVRLSNFKKVINNDVSRNPTINLADLADENELVLEIFPSDTKIVTQEKLRLNLKGKPKVTFSEDDNNVGVSSGYIVESKSLYDESKNYIKEDRITFSNYEDLIIEDYYLNFDIHRFNYTYKGKNDILDGNFYFLIYDKFNLFKELPLFNDTLYRYIELKPLIYNGDSIFSFKNKIYYDPLTHNPSNIYKEGYKETSKLYFPIGQLNTLKSIHCLLSFDIKGYTNFNMSSEFDIYFLKNYFGDCSDSEYCVEMNLDNGTNIREKVVDINL